jgi:hypothetical protein
MKKEMIKPVYKRWGFWIIILLAVCFLTVEIYMYQIHKGIIVPNYSLKCDAPRNLFCLDESGTKTIKDKIPCSSEDDCGWKNVRTFCAPGDGSFTDCEGEKVYCGEDGFCKQCLCR